MLFILLVSCKDTIIIRDVLNKNYFLLLIYFGRKTVAFCKEVKERGAEREGEGQEKGTATETGREREKKRDQQKQKGRNGFK